MLDLAIVLIQFLPVSCIVSVALQGVDSNERFFTSCYPAQCRAHRRVAGAALAGILGLYPLHPFVRVTEPRNHLR